MNNSEIRKHDKFDNKITKNKYYEFIINKYIYNNTESNINTEKENIISDNNINKEEKEINTTTTTTIDKNELISSKEIITCFMCLNTFSNDTKKDIVIKSVFCRYHHQHYICSLCHNSYLWKFLFFFHFSSYYPLCLIFSSFKKISSFINNFFSLFKQQLISNFKK